MLSLRSELRRKVLTFFYVNRSARVYVRQLASQLDVDSTNLSRELAGLEREGLLHSEIEGKQRYYSINPGYSYLKEFFAILQGSIGIMPTLQNALRKITGVESALLYGSLAKNEADASSDIDLLIIGNPGQAQLAAATRKAEKALRREINYTVLTQKELTRRLKKNDPLLIDIWNDKRIELMGHANDETAEDRSQAGSSVSG